MREGDANMTVHVLAASVPLPDIDVFYYLTLAFAMFATSFALRSKTKLVSYFAAAIGIGLLAVALLALAIKLNLIGR
jgi:hypothetical protein